MERENAEQRERCRHCDAQLAFKAAEHGKGHAETGGDDQKCDRDRAKIISHRNRRNDGGHAGKMHRGDARCGEQPCGRARTDTEFAADHQESKPEEGDREDDRQRRETRPETEGHRSVIGHHGNEMGRPHPNSRRERGDCQPLAAPNLDAVGRALKKQKKRGAAQHPDQRGQQDEPQIMLDDYTFDNREHRAPPSSSSGCRRSVNAFLRGSGKLLHNGPRA